MASKTCEYDRRTYGLGCRDCPDRGNLKVGCWYQNPQFRPDTSLFRQNGTSGLGNQSDSDRNPRDFTSTSRTR